VINPHPLSSASFIGLPVFVFFTSAESLIVTEIERNAVCPACSFFLLLKAAEWHEDESTWNEKYQKCYIGSPI